MVAVAIPAPTSAGSGPVHLPPTPSHSPLVAPKRLRSCLSPTRRYPSYPLDSFAIPLSQSSTISTDDAPGLTMSSAASTPMTSRSGSFSSACDEAHVVAGWRRAKSVRWEEQSEGEVAAAYYSTWSADDYDRSPLDPPKPEERSCILPARNSRCFSAAVSCFVDTGLIPHLDIAESPVTSPMRNVSADADAANDEADAEDAERDEWEECMNRRRMMMFASMHRSSPLPGFAGHAGHATSAPIPIAGVPAPDPPTLEGYTSLTATLAELLGGTGMSAEPRDVSTPVGSPAEHAVALPMPLPVSSRSPRLDQGQDGEEPVRDATPLAGSTLEDAMRGRPRLIRREREQVGSVIVEEEEEEEELEEAEEDEDDDGHQPSLETVMKALQAFRAGMRPGPLLDTGDEQRDSL